MSNKCVHIETDKQLARRLSNKAINKMLRKADKDLKELLINERNRRNRKNKNE